MNIYPTSLDPEKAARACCDVHTSKMMLETAQMLNTAALALGYDDPVYGKMSPGDKCTVWVGKSRENWDWMVEHGMAYFDEFQKRKKKGHKAFIGLLWAKQLNPEKDRFPFEGLTPFPMKVWPRVELVPQHPQECVPVYKRYYGRKEEAWMIVAKAEALIRLAAGHRLSKGSRPIMEWTEPGFRPDWMPERPESWSWIPNDQFISEAIQYADSNPDMFDRSQMGFAAFKRVAVNHRQWFVNLASQDFENVDVEVAKELIRLAS